MDFRLIKKIIFDLFKVDKINYGTTRILTVAHDTDRGYFYKGKYYSPLIDTIEDDLATFGIKCISIARIISTIKGDLSYGNVYSPEGGFARALLVKRIVGFLVKGKYPYSKLEEKIWSKILISTKAEKVLAIMPSRELCVACKKRGVWVADVQHGVIANNHPWYGKKFRENDPKERMPNSFLVWDFGSADVLNYLKNPMGIDVNIIGNRWVERFKNVKEKDTLVNESLESYNSFIEKTKKNRIVILVSLSWGQEGLTNGIIPDSLINLIKTTNKEICWLLRLHPNQIKGFASNESSKFIKLFNEHMLGCAEWETPTYAPLPCVLKTINLHIAWNSSVVIEAAQFGIKSATLDPRLRGELSNDYYDYYKRKGYIDFIEGDEKTILNWINNNNINSVTESNYSENNERYKNLLRFLISS